MQSCSLVLSHFRTTLLITMKFYVTLVLLVVLTTTIDAATTPQGVCASFEQDGLMQSCNDYRNYHGKPDMEHCEAKEKTMTAAQNVWSQCCYEDGIKDDCNEKLQEYLTVCYGPSAPYTK